MAFKKETKVKTNFTKITIALAFIITDKSLAVGTIDRKSVV